MNTAALQRTPLYDEHVALGGRMVPFAGWEMPVQYEGVLAEHRAVRERAGVFDVSHMGELLVQGPSAALQLQRLLSNDLGKLVHDGYAQYTLLTNEHGGIEDDLIVSRLAADRFLLVVNAANTAHDLEWLQSHLGDGASVEDVSDRYGMLALQGPLALDVLAELGMDLRTAPAFRSFEGEIAGIAVTVTTTGYTGERGCEILVDADRVAEVWRAIVRDERVQACGLACRDTLRLEVCYPLHGSDIDSSTSAVAAGLSWVCGWSTGFLGRDALQAERERGTDRSLVALQMDERGIPRAGCDVLDEHETVVGEVTSGTMSPSLGIGIALAYVGRSAAAAGTPVQIDVRGRRYAAHVVDKPIYRKERA